MTAWSGAGGAQIHDGGFRPYVGPRLAPGKSFGSLLGYSIGRLVGRKRRFRSKLIALSTFFVAWIAAVVQVFIAALAAELSDLNFDVAREYYTWAGVGVVLFTVLATPLLLSADRRSGLLSLYLASPLSRRGYLNAQTMAVGSLLIAMTLVPTLVLGIVYTALGSGPGHFGDFMLFCLRSMASAVSVALLPTLLAVAVCSVVRGSGLAIVVIGLALVVPSGITSLLIEVAGAAPEIVVLDPLRLSRALAKRSQALALGDLSPGSLDAVATWLVVVANLAWAALLSGLAHWRYGRIEVER